MLDAVIKYLKDNKNKFSKEVLIDQLLRVGHPESDIKKAVIVVYGKNNLKLTGDVIVEESYEKIGKNEYVKRSEKDNKFIFFLFPFLSVLILYMFFSYVGRMAFVFLNFEEFVWIGNLFAFVLFMPEYLLQLYECENGMDEWVIIFQFIYVYLWLNVIKFSFAKKYNKNNKVLKFFVQEMKQNRKFIILYFLGFLAISFFLLFQYVGKTEVDYYGREKFCFNSTIENVKSCLKSNTSVRYKGEIHRNKCDKSTGYFTEYKCVNDNVVEEQVKCEFGCGYNTCLTTSSVVKCFDNDGDDKYVSSGIVGTGGRKIFDYCSVDGEILYEYVCNGDSTFSVKRYDCEHGCKDGACQRVVPSSVINVETVTCIDSDESSDSRRGYVKFGTQIYYDYCMGVNKYEYMCSSVGGPMTKVLVQCSTGCRSGVCIKNQKGDCQESDAGKDYYHEGEIFFANGHSSDQCLNDTLLIEHYCSEDGKSLIDQYDCDYGCRDGKCLGSVNKVEVAPIINHVGCFDSDRDNSNPKGYVQSNNKTYYDICSGENKFEYFCNPVGDQVDKRLDNCENGCEDGECVSVDLNTRACVDGDGGFNYYEKAATAGRGTHSLYNRWYTIEDNCYKDANPNKGFSNQLHEQYCSEDDRVISRSYQCPNGCEDGACVK